MQDAKAAEKAAKKQKALDKEATRLKEAAEKNQNGSASKSKKAASKDAKVSFGDIENGSECKETEGSQRLDILLNLSEHQNSQDCYLS